MNDRHRFLRESYGVPEELSLLLEEVEYGLHDEFARIDDTADYLQIRLLRIFQEHGATDFHLHGSTGYGYGDAGRDVLEAVFADYFGCESALVRNQIISGTHAIALGLSGNLRPGGGLISALGQPYDTLRKVIGAKGEAGSLVDAGVDYREIPLTDTGKADIAALAEAVDGRTEAVFIQRSKGYQWRPSVTTAELKAMIAAVKRRKPEVACIVDNCYCEFADALEPGYAGADLVIGSLIKNPGGTLAPSGGYIAGKKHYVNACARRLSAPGLEEGTGASLGFNRPVFQGFFQAPMTVGQSLKGAALAAGFFQRLGYEVLPNAGAAERPDIVQAIKLGDEGKLIRFCRAIQRACPLDASFAPEPAMLPGYDCPVIMAGGGFIQGSSSELSADGPLRPPYIAYLQGGFSLAQIRLGLLLAAKALVSEAN